MDYALWYANHDDLHVSDNLLDKVEEEMTRTKDYRGLATSIATLRAANAKTT
ncbi:hypothetical protein Clow_00237 [Corynebacterium lowii]|uniref:Uncharacterized protein n=1 Tax=Corynebacterium lowii TaxID=1544413 RepID=A0A0Q0YK28_9CORY|nr:hypothetical protein Clow_00237 [Corynebacterium lowii]MDP9852229.1 hypothetical protein [Corynebacterium lowii]